MICPICHGFNDEALTPSGRLPPQDWHPLICIVCETVLVVDCTAPGGLRQPAIDDYRAWAADEKIALALIRTLSALTRREWRTQT